MILGFLRQYGPKDDKSFLGKLVNKIRKRDNKGDHKELRRMPVLYEDPESDFDF